MTIETDAEELGLWGISDGIVGWLVIPHLMRNPKGFAFTGKRKDNGKVSFNGFLVPLRQGIKKPGFITSN